MGAHVIEVQSVPRRSRMQSTKPARLDGERRATRINIIGFRCQERTNRTHDGPHDSRVLGDEARAQLLETRRENSPYILACVGGGSMSAENVLSVINGRGVNS